jgi:hypothetical protein
MQDIKQVPLGLATSKVCLLLLPPTIVGLPDTTTSHCQCHTTFHLSYYLPLLKVCLCHCHTTSHLSYYFPLVCLLLLLPTSSTWVGYIEGLPATTTSHCHCHTTSHYCRSACYYFFPLAPLGSAALKVCLLLLLPAQTPFCGTGKETIISIHLKQEASIHLEQEASLETSTLRTRGISRHLYTWNKRSLGSLHNWNKRHL